MALKDTIRHSPLARTFARHAGKIAGLAGTVGAGLLVANRSVSYHAATMDRMTLSGVLLLGSCLAMFPVDRWPVFKRVSGALGLGYVGLLMADTWSKPDSGGMIITSVLPAVLCAAMILERKRTSPEETPAHPQPASVLRRAWDKAAAGYAAAPVFWPSVAGLAVKPFTWIYGRTNHERLFPYLVAAMMLENLSCAITDNAVKRFFHVGENDEANAPASPAL